MRPKSIPPFLKPQKPKHKGKKPSAPKLKTADEIDSLDIFHTAMSADAGSDSSRSSQEAFKRVIHYMSMAQLSKIERHILKIKDQALDQNKEKVCDLMVGEINERLRISAEVGAKIAEDIRKKLADLEIDQPQYAEKGGLLKVKVGEKWLSIHSLIKKKFPEELTQVRQLIKDGTIVVMKRNHGASAFIKSCIEYLLAS